MRQFSFRLSSILRLKEARAQELRSSLASKRLEISSFEDEIEKLNILRNQLFDHSPISLSDYSMRDLRKSKLDDISRSHSLAISLLQQEEEGIRDLYFKAKLEVETLKLLEAQEFKEWKRQAQKLEQKRLDEWSILRQAG